MKKTIVAVAALAVVASASAATTNFLLLPPAAPAGQFTLFGHIKKLTRAGTSRYVMRFDPAMFTTGLTASVAAKEDTGSSDVPNDVYRVEESHRLYSYYVPSNAKVTVLTNHGTQGITATPISVAELYRIVNGGPHRKLFEPLLSGVWIRVRIDTVKEIDQQYQP
jgi:hypothetical protein